MDCKTGFLVSETGQSATIQRVCSVGTTKVTTTVHVTLSEVEQLLREMHNREVEYYSVDPYPDDEF